MPVTIKTVAMKRCPYRLTVTTPGGLVCIEEKQCALMRDHDGFHRAQDGSVWQNDVSVMRQLGLDT